MNVFIVFLFIFCHVVFSGGYIINNRPIIGVLTQDSLIPSPGKNSFIAASYVKYIESAGARVAPVQINNTKKEYIQLFKSINGILFPGGGVSLKSSGYAKTAELFYRLALEANSNGDYFPVWGTCLGFELLTLLTSTESLLSNTNTTEVALPLNFTKDSKECRMFKDFPQDLMNSLAIQPLTANAHKYSITTEDFYGNEKLKKFYKVLSTNTDGQKEFVSTMEAFDYPIYGTQWHPEKNSFEWIRLFIPHSPAAVRTTFYMAQFFVNEAKKSFHTFPSFSEEEQALIYNYRPTYTGKKSGFEQIYYFD